MIFMPFILSVLPGCFFLLLQLLPRCVGGLTIAFVNLLNVHHVESVLEFAVLPSTYQDDRTLLQKLIKINHHNLKEIRSFLFTSRAEVAVCPP